MFPEVLSKYLNTGIGSRIKDTWKTWTNFLKETQEMGSHLSTQVFFSVWKNMHQFICKPMQSKTDWETAGPEWMSVVLTSRYSTWQWGSHGKCTGVEVHFIDCQPGSVTEKPGECQGTVWLSFWVSCHCNLVHSVHLKKCWRNICMSILKRVM